MHAAKLLPTGRRAAMLLPDELGMRAGLVMEISKSPSQPSLAANKAIQNLRRAHSSPALGMSIPRSVPTQGASP